jgi:hypothetical protein
MTSLDISDNKIGSGYYGSTDGSQALSTALKSNSNLKELNISSNYFKADDAKILADGISGNGALTSLNLANNGLSAESFMGSTELYVEEKLVASSVAYWAPTLHQALPSDRLEVVSASPPLAGGDITNVTEVLGKAVMVSRGACTFGIKAQHLQAAGAMAMICVNNDKLEPDGVFPMGADDAENINIPVVMVSFNTGAQIRAMAEMAITVKKSFSLIDALKNHK